MRKDDAARLVNFARLSRNFRNLRVLLFREFEPAKFCEMRNRFRRPLFAEVAKKFMRVTQLATKSDEIWKVSFFETEGVIRWLMKY